MFFNDIVKSLISVSDEIFGIITKFSAPLYDYIDPSEFDYGTDRYLFNRRNSEIIQFSLLTCKVHKLYGEIFIQ